MWLIFSLISYSFGEAFSKMFANNHNLWMAFAALLCYTVNAAFWLPALCQMNQLAVLGSIWAVSYTILSVLIGIFFFSEVLTICQTIGIVLGLMAIILLTL